MNKEKINSVITKTERIRKQDTEIVKMFYHGKDITSLLIRIPETLTEEEQQLLKQFYSLNGREFVENGVTKNKILPFAANVLMKIDCDKGYWSTKHDMFVKRNKEIKNLLESVFLKMDDIGCQSLTVVENFAALLRSNSCLGCFCSGDVDLSADIREKEMIISCLKSMNFLYDFPSVNGQVNSDQISMFFNNDVISGGFWINILWQPITRSFLLQDKYNARLSNDRIQSRFIEGTKIRVLNETSLMYFCALHIASGHYYTVSPGLRLYVDIDRLARGCRINWDELLTWSQEDAAGIRVAVVLYLSNKLLKTPIPHKVYQKALKNKRNNRLINYLINTKTNEIQNKGDKFRKLYVDLASDDKNLVYAFITKIVNLFQFKS